ncbi:MAG: FecR family protein [Burkholderiales bacterium]|nr:FecR family protein [Burkholderiales bacterium]
MNQHYFKLGGRGILMLAVASAYPTAAHSAPAARVEFAAGNPTAQGPSGTVRALAKGAEIGSGDLVDTKDGRVQLRFVDGAYVSLQPQSQFRIDDFRFNGQQDGSERGFFSLLKGGLRTITGLVGRNNKNNYQVTTTVATIGIRGTEYTIQYGKSITGSVGGGEINVCNAGGCLNVVNGESYYVASPDVKPQLTDKKVDLPPQQPQTAPTNFTQGDTRTTLDPAGFILTGTQTVHLAYAAGSTPTFLASTTAVFDESGAMRQANFGSVKTWNGPVLEQGNDGIIAWGRWTGDYVRDASGNPIADLTATSLHYVAGLPTPSADLAAFSTAQLKGEYQLIGGTTPTWSSGGVAGTLTGASLVAEFGASRVTGSVSVNVGGVNYSGTNTGFMTTGGTFSTFGSSGGGGLMFSGFFAGANAIRAGMAYDLSIPGGQVQGAATFRQTGLTDASGAPVAQ